MATSALYVMLRCTVAVIVRQEIALVNMVVFLWWKRLSVMLQVSFVSFTKKRQHRLATLKIPSHHHFRKKSGMERKPGSWSGLITMLLCFVGLSTLKLR
jgi:phospho-N-acetylmuramoyl-pentapeptide-transferase